MKNPLLALRDAGQAVWIDFIDRPFLAEGKLRQLIAEDGLAGVTSNPSIFEKAMGYGDAYDEGFKSWLASAGAGATAIEMYEAQAILDIQSAADDLRRVYDESEGKDGYASLEVSPYLAKDSQETIEEARRLWAAVKRPNLMVKVPGTEAGTLAIRQLIEDGLNINVTLLFSQDAYHAVADAFLAGMEARVKANKPINRIASVASFFVSRVDAQIDSKIDERIRQGDSQSKALRALRGKVAIANAKVAYAWYREMIASPRWQVLASQGAMPQRLLWASTGTKDPSYSPTFYVDALIGPDTVNTMPPKTLDAFRQQGKVAPTLSGDIEGARHVLAETDRLGLNLPAVTAALAEEGVGQFTHAADKLLAAIEKKRAEFSGSEST